MSPKLKPFLKWPGGKRAVLEQLLEHFPQEISGSYYEPFLGGGSVGLAVPYRKKILSDSNEELINAYKVVRDSPDILIQHLKEISHSSQNYYEFRSWDRAPEFAQIEPAKRAARFIYLNKTGFNGLYRVNRNGHFNVPYGGPRSFIVEIELIKRLSEEFKGNKERKYKFASSDFRTALRLPKSGDFVYLDPPYIPLSSTANFVDYSPAGFSLATQIELAEIISGLTKKGVRVILSNSDTPATREIFGAIGKMTAISAPRLVSAKISGRTAVPEVIIDNMGEL